MNIVSTAFLALSLSTDAFAVAVSKGASVKHPKPSEALKTGLVFGLIEAITPIIGWSFGAMASGFITAIDHWLAFFILSGLGFKMLWDSAQPFATQDVPSRHKLRTLVVAGLGSSIDALGVGVTLAFIDADIWLTASAIGSTTFLMATLGVLVGNKIGNRIGMYAGALGGLVLISIGTKILLEHTGFI